MIPEETEIEEYQILYARGTSLHYAREGRDIILLSYRNPDFREDVVTFFEGITGSSEIAEVILSNASVLDVSPALAFALCDVESAYNPRAINHNRNETVDRGLFQLNSASFPQQKAEEFYDPDTNARLGILHLRWCLETAGSEVAGLAMYNAGETRVRSAGTPKSTLDYVSKIQKKERKIEELFLNEYLRIAMERSLEEGTEDTVEKTEKVPIRLTLLTPLGAR